MYRLLKESFENMEWKPRGNYCIKHEKLDLELWISNGSTHFDFNDSPFTIPFYMRPFLWRHCKKMIRRMLNERLRLY